jgi:SAM-dependent methyltransferase
MATSGGMTLNDQVRGYWEKQPCGTDSYIVGETPEHSRDWFERVEEYRYSVEPFIHGLAQFTRHHGKKVLEVGVGAGTDHLQWARAGAECHGVDLTDAAIEVTRERLATYGFHSNLQRVDAEVLPFDDESFDVVYSWGVIHHSEQPAAIIAEIHRILKPGGLFLGMMYGRRSYCVFKLWLKYALLRGRPWRSFAEVMWHHMESEGTKGYTVRELRELFGAFDQFKAVPVITDDERKRFPAWLHQFFPSRWGFFITLRATK